MCLTFIYLKRCLGVTLGFLCFQQIEFISVFNKLCSEKHWFSKEVTGVSAPGVQWSWEL